MDNVSGIDKSSIRIRQPIPLTESRCASSWLVPRNRRQAIVVSGVATCGLLAYAAAAEPAFALYPVRRFGYVGDGRSHPLSSVAQIGDTKTVGWTLTQWQSLFPRALSLSDEIDRHAIQRYCDVNLTGVLLDLPPGIAIIDKGLVTGGKQHVRLRGAGRDLTELWFFQSGGTLWAHGATVPASGTWYVEAITIRPKTICLTAFAVSFAGDQPAWCHVMRDVQFVPADAESYFQNACVTRNIKRGLDWNNIVAYGRHFHILSSNAFEFPANLDQSTAGNSYNFNNVMTVGYAYAIEFGFDGFKSDRNHMHEEAQLYNVQAYAGNGLLRARNGNYAFAPADNFTLSACGWQGTGPALDLEYLEHVRVRDTLFVNDTVTTSAVCFARLADCDSVLLDANEIFSPTGSGIIGIEATGAKTRNVVLERTDIVAYAHFVTFLRVASDVPEGGVEERNSRFAGSATFARGKIEDLSGKALSETRALELATLPSSPPALPGSTSVSLDEGGNIVWNAIVVAPTADDAGTVPVKFPPGLFRSVKSVSVTNSDSRLTTSWVTVLSIDKDGVAVRYPQPGLPRNSSTSTNLQVIGR